MHAKDSRITGNSGQWAWSCGCASMMIELVCRADSEVLGGDEEGVFVSTLSWQSKQQLPVCAPSDAEATDDLSTPCRCIVCRLALGTPPKAATPTRPPAQVSQPSRLHHHAPLPTAAGKPPVYVAPRAAENPTSTAPPPPPNRAHGKRAGSRRRPSRRRGTHVFIAFIAVYCSPHEPS